MLVLKDLDGIAEAFGNTPVAQSPIWNQSVGDISPAQIFSLRTRLTLTSPRARVDTLIDELLRRVAEATKGAKDPAPMLTYLEPNKSILGAAELVRGLSSLDRPMPAAILFGLEMRMRIDEVVTLTWPKAKRMASRGKLTGYARRILVSQPVNIASGYVFWTHHNGKPLPVFGLEQSVFDAFGCVWGELQAGYENLSLADFT